MKRSSSCGNGVWLLLLRACLTAAMVSAADAQVVAAEPDLQQFVQQHCSSCHSGETPEGGLELTALKPDFRSEEAFSTWVKVYDRLRTGEMPPADAPRPPAAAVSAVTDWLQGALLRAEQARFGGLGRTRLRRLTRTEYENTVRDLFGMPGIALRNSLPADGSAHGFDTNAEALDISHVNVARYMEAADHVLDYAIATRPEPPPETKYRLSLATQYIVQLILLNGDAVLLKDGKPDPEFPPAGEHRHLDHAAHNRMGVFERGSTVGVFRHEDESFNPNFQSFATLYPGQYRLRASFWSFGWDKGQVQPARGVEAARLSVVQLMDRGRGGGHPSYVLGYYDAPSLKPQVHEFVTWLNYKETIGFNAASLAPVHNYNRKGRAMAFTGPGVASDWLELEGPLHGEWPPVSHRLLFGDLPLVEFQPEQQADVRPPKRSTLRQEIISAKNRPEPPSGLWTVHSGNPLADADRLLAGFLPRAFRRPVPEDVRRQYVALVESRLQSGDCFETAMRAAYRTALCSPDFLYHVEPAGKLDGHALACRLSYFFWRSCPDERLTELAETGKLAEPVVLRSEVERLLQDSKSRRFVEDFTGQWLKLRQIAATDPDRKLYPEFSPYLQDSMVGETRAYFRELIEQDLDASHLIQSDFAMLNEKLATHYGIPGVSGPGFRRVPLPADLPRGPFLTQASILKLTANGTTTSPVPRGAFVMDRLFGQPPEPPPPDIPAVEPDVRGATTIREQLDRHRSQTVCASCHAKMDPPGFALESFDVIGGFRERYRSIGEGDPAERGPIDPFIHIGFRLGPPVDSAGVLPDGETFRGIRDYQQLMAARTPELLRNMARQFAVYGTGRAVGFGDRAEVERIVEQTLRQGGGLRTLIHQLVQSRLFQTR